MSIEVIKVTFRQPPEDDEPFAIFPETEADNNGNLLCYHRIGQHGGCHPSFLDAPRATIEQYAPLLRELRRVYGYHNGVDLEVV